MGGGGVSGGGGVVCFRRSGTTRERVKKGARRCLLRLGTVVQWRGRARLNGDHVEEGGGGPCGAVNAVGT
jgi:hypothetical protein